MFRNFVTFKLFGSHWLIYMREPLRMITNDEITLGDLDMIHKNPWVLIGGKIFYGNPGEYHEAILERLFDHGDWGYTQKEKFKDDIPRGYWWPGTSEVYMYNAYKYSESERQNILNQLEEVL